MTRTRNLLILIIIITAIISVIIETQSTTKLINAVTYACDNSKSITAEYYESENRPTPAPGTPPIPGGSVIVKFDNGEPITLQQTISADGARYANTDESLVFWSKGDGALVLENGEEKNYKNCTLFADR